jgi:primosomal protein N' (replication factor Y)
MIFAVVFPLPVAKHFDYSASPTLSSPINPVGCRVRVPFGPRHLVGLVVGVRERNANDVPGKLKDIAQWVDPQPVLDSLQVQLGKWMAWRTACSEGEALFSLLPPDKEKARAEQETPHHDAWLETHSNAPSALTWTSDQKKAIDALHEIIFSETSGASAVLLRGIAASGKTEVYFAAINDALRKHQNVLVLAPEVGLVLQLSELLKHRFGADNVAVWHGAVPLSERKKLWWKIRSGDVSIVVGARSAALLPLPNVGLFVLDEEHDTAWKEDRKPRFHARDVVMERARLSNAVAILATATPTFEVEQMAKDGVIREVVLNERAVNAGLPELELVDMNSQQRRGVLSQQLKKALDDTIARKEQAILFINRRGFHRYLRCGKCDWVARCPQCGVTLVVHGKTLARKNFAPRGSDMKAPKPDAGIAGRLVCHQCAHQTPVPSVCPECNAKGLYSGGVGTERVMAELKEHMPWVRAARWDMDVVKKKGALNDLLADMRARELDVLVGTQLVAQGFHFPHVTLVGVIDADVALHQPNFRASERTFQLVTQVAGRAGRDLVKGRVLIQTHQSHHPALKFAAAMDFENFFKEECGFRRDLRYPPFTHLVQMDISLKDEAKSAKAMEEFVAWIENLKTADPVGVLGPMVPLRRHQGRKSLQCLLKVDLADFDFFLTSLQSSGFLKANFRLNIDPL